MPYPAKISREKILKHGLRIVEKAGIEALSLRTIARRLKVAVNALYNYFPNRRALESAIAAEGYRIMRSNLAKASSDAPAAATLKALCKTYLRFARDHRRLFELMSRKRPPKLELEAINGEFASLITKMRGGRSSKDHSAKEAFALIAMLRGIIAVEQQMHLGIPATHVDFAVSEVISAITRTREKNRTPRRSKVRSGKFGR